MDLRAMQRPLKQAYREDPARARITLTARASPHDAGPVACSVDIGRAICEAQAHAGVGGPGTAACSGDLLLGALAACKQITVQMVAAAMGLPVEDVEVTVEGDLDLRGTLGISPDVPVGFTEIRLAVRVRGELTPEQEEALRQRAERYCVVLQTLRQPPPIRIAWESGAAGTAARG